MHFVDDHRFSIHRARVTQGVKWFRDWTQGFLFARKSTDYSFFDRDLAQLWAVQLRESLFLLVNLETRDQSVELSQLNAPWILRAMGRVRNLKTDAVAQQSAAFEFGTSR